MISRLAHVLVHVIAVALAAVASVSADSDSSINSTSISKNNSDSNKSPPSATTTALALGYGPLGYTLPAPGSYWLPAIGAAPDGEILNDSGRTTSLHREFGSGLTLLNFMYSSCSDINGCPLSSQVFYQVKSAMEDDPELAENLKLISMSFDPVLDTPEKMRLYGESFRFTGDRGEWSFVTTASEEKLVPILSAYGQEIQRNFIVSSDDGSDISHLLRVYLIDDTNTIRNIYSVSYLHADILVNDVKTILLQKKGNPISSGGETSRSLTLSRPGDDKTGYEGNDYKTNSRSLSGRKGLPANLMRYVDKAPLGLPPIPVPDSNPITPEKIDLGRKVFFNRRLSINDTFSCAMCHVPEQGFSSNEMATAVGVEGRTVRRNSPTIYNVAYATTLFHDGRENTLEQQAWTPFLQKNEMANPSIGYVLQKIRSFTDYRDLFETAFDGRPVSMETLGMAVASYQRTLVSGNSRFDRWYFGKETGVLTEEEMTGFRLFNGSAGCSACHRIDSDHALFTDNDLHNTGIGYSNSLGDSNTPKRVTLAPGIFIDVDPEIIKSVGEKRPADVGQYEVTEDPADRWKYKTPSLRNVALTGPYMHNGELRTLSDVVSFYDNGGVPNPLLDPLIRPLELSADEMSAIVAFLESLTGDNVDELTADAFAAPVGDPKQSIDSTISGNQ